MGAGKFSLFDPTRTSGKLMQKIIILVFLVLALGCKSGKNFNQKRDFTIQKQVTKLKSKQINLVLKQLVAHDIQENFTFHDELFVTYSLSVVEKDCIVMATHASHVINKVKKGSKWYLDSIPSLNLEIKDGQKLGVQVALWEIDDYSKSQKLINKVSMVSGALQLPLTFIEWSSVSNPLGWFLWGTRLSSMGLGFLAKLDQDDLLGTSEVVWEWKDLPMRGATRFKRVQWQGENSSLNSFHYEMGYEIKVRDNVN